MLAHVALLVALFATVGRSHATPHLHKQASSVTSSSDVANGQTFNYIVVGAGLTGTTMAARLAENAALKVLLIEAGGDNRANSQVYNIYAYSQAFNGPMDCAWRMDQEKVMHGGKTLGGSLSINSGHWTLELNAQYDVWSSLLETSEANVGWNWNNLWAYMKKAGTFSAPNTQQRAKGADSIASYHGTTGPVQVTYPDLMYGGPQQPAFISIIQNLTGISHFIDINGGTPNTVSITPFSINWHDIRDSALLSKFGIKSLNDLKTVGGNLQEQTMNSLGAHGSGFNKGGRGPSDCIAFPNIYQMFGSQATAVVQKMQASLGAWA